MWVYPSEMCGLPMASKAVQQHVDAAGRLAAIITHLGTDCDQADVLAWCSEANIAMTNDTKVPSEAFIAVMGDG